MWVSFWALCSVPLMSVFVPAPHCFDYCSFVVLSEVWEVMPPALFFFLRIPLAILGLLWFHINFRIICSSSVGTVIGNLIGITWKDAQHLYLLEKYKSKLQWGITSHQSEWLSFKSLQITNAGEGVEKRESSNTVGGNVNWCSHYGKQYGGSSKNWK